MANTENIEAKLCAYIDGDLDAAGRAEIEKHLAANPQHRGLIEQLSKQRDLLRELPRESAPEEILDALQSHMERSVLLGDVDAAEETAALKIQRWPQLMAMAAIVILTVGLGVFIYMMLPRNGGGDAIAIRTDRGATLDEGKDLVDTGAAIIAEPSTDVARRGGAIGKSAAGDIGGERELAKANTGEIPAIPAAPPTVAPSAAATPTADSMAKAKADADVFAPAKGGVGAGGGGTALAMNDVIDAQNRVQNADLARQLKDAPGGLKGDAMFVVVNTADPSAARNEVTNYLATNKIAWDPVTLPMPEPLDALQNQAVSLSRSQSVNVRMKSGPPTAEQQAQQVQQQAPQEAQQEAQQEAPQEAQQEAQQPQQEKLADAMKKAEAPNAPAGAVAQSGQPSDAAATVQQRPAAAAPAEEQKELAQQPQQPQQDDFSGVADGRRMARAPGPMTNVREADAGLLQATTRDAQGEQRQELVQQQQPVQSQQQALQAPARDSRLIIARGMTKQQAAELQSNLSKQTTVQRAAVYEQRTMPVGMPAPAPALQRSREFSAATTSPTTQAVDAAKQFAEHAAPTTGPASQSLFGGTVAAAAPTTQEAALTATTAPAAIQVPLTLSEADRTAPLGVPTTHETAAAADERVDVVILVQDDVPDPTLMEDPTLQLQPNAAPAPTTNPTATTHPAVPATQPVPDVTF